MTPRRAGRRRGAERRAADTAKGAATAMAATAIAIAATALGVAAIASPRPVLSAAPAAPIATAASATRGATLAPRVLPASTASDAFDASTARATRTRDFSRLDDLLTRVAADVPRGLEVLIVQNGEQIYWKQFGGWPKNKQVPIASATKWLSGAVIMSLVDSNLLSLDDRAAKYLPCMTGEKGAITIRQLMSHTAGFAGEFPLAHRCLGDATDTLDRCARSIASVPLRAPAGAAFIYAGADMQIAGRVAEVASGKDWQTLFHERVATPLGLTQTDYNYRGPTRNPRISGGARSTVSDYMKFLTMLQQQGRYEGRRVLSSQAVETMLRDQTAGVAIVETPFRRAASQHPHAVDNRYGIGNWLEDLDASGHAALNSSPGLLGFTPYLDTQHHLQVVVGVEALRKFQPYYPQLKTLIRSLTAADAE